MIAKFDMVNGHSFARLLDFVHSRENTMSVPSRPSNIVVRIKSVSPENQGGGTWYGLTLDIEEEIEGTRVDPKFLLRVYNIIDRSDNRHFFEGGNGKSPEDPYPPLKPGTTVRTTRPDMSRRRDWTEEGWSARKWGVSGSIITHHDSHGLCYDVHHKDGTQASYNPNELEIEASKA